MADSLQSATELAEQIRFVGDTLRHNSDGNTAKSRSYSQRLFPKRARNYGRGNSRLGCTAWTKFATIYGYTDRRSAPLFTHHPNYRRPALPRADRSV